MVTYLYLYLYNYLDLKINLHWPFFSKAELFIDKDSWKCVAQFACKHFWC